VCTCRAAEDSEEVKVAEEKDEGEGNESGLDELMLLARSRRLSEEPERQPDADAATALPADALVKEEAPGRDESEVIISIFCSSVRSAV
jgi:hypothetical protein